MENFENIVQHAKDLVNNNKINLTLTVKNITNGVSHVICNNSKINLMCIMLFLIQIEHLSILIMQIHIIAHL